jgi:hypothetical protein
MISGLETPPDPAAPGLIHPATENPAVALCCKAYARMHSQTTAAGKSSISAKFDAGSAYRNAMPPLDGQENIRNFIACAAHAMLLGILESSDGAKLLYAAQVASGLLPKPSLKDPKAAKEPQDAYSPVGSQSVDGPSPAPSAKQEA